MQLFKNNQYMSTTVVNTGTEGKTWGGGNKPLKMQVMVK